MIFYENETIELKIQFDVRNKLNNQIFDKVAFSFCAGIWTTLGDGNINTKKRLDVILQVREDLENA